MLQLLRGRFCDIHSSLLAVIMLNSGLQHIGKVNRAPGGEANGVETNFWYSDREENLIYNKNIRKTTSKTKT